MYKQTDKFMKKLVPFYPKQPENSIYYQNFPQKTIMIVNDRINLDNNIKKFVLDMLAALIVSIRIA